MDTDLHTALHALTEGDRTLRALLLTGTASGPEIRAAVLHAEAAPLRVAADLASELRETRRTLAEVCTRHDQLGLR